MFKQIYLFLSVALLSSHAAAQERGVIVKQMDRELKRLAFQLKVSPDQVVQARKLLRKMTVLAPDFHDQNQIQSLGRFWITLDEQAARDQLKDLLRSLSQSAKETEDSGQYGRITSNARTIADSLETLDPELSEQIMDSWPTAPELTADQLASQQRRQRSVENQKLRTRLADDVDLGLEELRRMEGDGMRLEARHMAISRLYSEARLQDASELLDETIDLVSKASFDDQTFNELQNLLSNTANFGTQSQAERLAEIWASASESFNPPNGKPEAISGVEFTFRERRILDGLRSLRDKPELALRSLGYFPELKQKVLSVGGLGAVHAEQQRRWSGLDESSLRGKSELEIEFDRALRMDAPYGFGVQSFNQQAERLEELLQSLPLLDDPELEVRLYQRSIQSFFPYQGELTAEIRRQGLEYVGEIRGKRSQGTESSEGRRTDLERLEANIYAMWLWSDPQEAALALETLPPETRLRALGGYLANLTEIHGFGTWHWR